MKAHQTNITDEIRDFLFALQDEKYRDFQAKLIPTVAADALDEDYDPVYPEKVSLVRSSEYYVNMMIAWYFATALAKQYETILPYIELKKLDVWTHNKAIQKATESYRITAEQKDYLKTLKVK